MIAQSTKKASKIDWYARYTMAHLTTATDDNGLYCEVLSERIEGLRYRVDMDEMTMTATRCQCAATRPCKHMNLVNAAFAHKASQVTCEVEAGKFYICDHTHQVWLHDGKWFCSCGNTETCQHRETVKQHLAIEPVIETPAQEVVIEEEVAPVVETAPEEAPVEPKQTYRIVTAPGPKRERRDLLAEIEAKRESKFELLGEISEIKARAARTPDMMKAPLNQNRAFSILR